MNKFFKKILLFAIVSVLFISTISIDGNQIQAKAKTYKGFTIVQNDSKKTILSKLKDGITIYVTYDKVKDTFSSKSIDNKTKEVTKYKLDVETAVKDKKEIEYMDLSTNTKYKQVNDDIEKVQKKGTLQPKFVWAIPIGITITAAAIDAMIGLGTAIVIAGVGCIAYSKFKNKKKKYDYYRAYIEDDGLYFGDGYSKKTAIKKMKKDGANIWSTSASKARTLAKEVSPVKKTSGSERDKKEPKGKFKHYHPIKKKKERLKVKGHSVHSFYGTPYAG